jgi:hypothetical protein
MSPCTALEINVMYSDSKKTMTNGCRSFGPKLDEICDKLFDDIGNPYEIICAKCNTNHTNPKVIEVLDDLWDIVQARHESRWVLIDRSTKKIPRKERTAIGRQLVADPALVVEEFVEKVENAIDREDPLLFDVFNAAIEYLDHYLELETTWVAKFLELIHTYGHLKCDCQSRKNRDRSRSGPKSPQKEETI